MQRMTNDNTDLVNPQAAHILFSEFKKFMFLNSKFVIKQSMTSKYERQADIYEEENSEPVRAMNGLYAPPAIDQIWCILLGLKIPYGIFSEFSKGLTYLDSEGKMNIYEGFGEEIFGIRLDRPILPEDYDPKDVVPQYGYELTLVYLKCFELSLKPFPLIWPDYSHKNYVADLKSTIHVLLLEKLSLVNLGVERTSRSSDKMTYMATALLTNNIIDHYSGLKTVKLQDSLKIREKLRKFDSLEIKDSELFPRSFDASVDKAWKKVINGLEGEKYLHKRVIHKYGLDIDTGHAWILEFKKFFTLKLFQKEIQADWNLVPGSIVECVWRTYFEISHYYRKFCSHLLTETPYPELIIYSNPEDYESKPLSLPL